jgi:23S rRNA (cytidine1920-2'-O)/16S rRNA (cytidine1409-2'-O)-methyltransferase
MTRSRLDLVLVERGLVATRARARDAVLRGTVRVDGEVAVKASANVADDARIEIDDPAGAYVARSAVKLADGLDAFALSPVGRTCLDIGASAGGFTQVLLERGATHVTAIDVGHDQMAEIVAKDPRVTSIEGLNARDLEAEDLAHPAEFIVADVSFISLTIALPPALDLAPEGAVAVVLVKPQFEVGKGNLARGGIVKDEELALASVDRIEAFFVEEGWRVLGRVAASIAGGDGNREFLVAAQKAKAGGN